MQPRTFGVLTDNGLVKTIKSSTFESCLSCISSRWGIMWNESVWEKDTAGRLTKRPEDTCKCLAKLFHSAQTWSTEWERGGESCLQKEHRHNVLCITMSSKHKQSRKQGRRFKRLSSKDKTDQLDCALISVVSRNNQRGKYIFLRHGRRVNTPLLHCKNIPV